MRCFNGTSSGYPPIVPPLFSLTCCDSRLLSGPLPTFDNFVSSTCCLPGGQTCLIDQTCCSGKCLGLRSGSTSGNCSGLALAYNDPVNAPIIDYQGYHPCYDQTPSGGANHKPPIEHVHHHHHHIYHWINPSNFWNPFTWYGG